MEIERCYGLDNAISKLEETTCTEGIKWLVKDKLKTINLFFLFCKIEVSLKENKIGRCEPHY